VASADFKSRACGNRFDISPPSSTVDELDERTLEALLNLQQRLVALLTAKGRDTCASVGWRVPTGHYFLDMRALVPLVFLTWPESRHLAPTPLLANVLDAEAEWRHKAYREARAASAKKHPSRFFSHPPEDALVLGAVLGIAERLLQAKDEESAFDLLRPLIYRSLELNPILSYHLRSIRPASVPLRAVLTVDRRKRPRTYVPESRAEVIQNHPGYIRSSSPGKCEL